MKVCYTGGAVKDCGSYYSVATNAVELRIWFLTDDILRIRAGFDGDWDEASYSLTMTAWESRTDELMKDCRKRVQSAAAALTDGDRLLFGDMAIYTTCKNNTFNGMPLPPIWAMDENGTCRELVKFGYSDFKMRLGRAAD